MIKAEWIEDYDMRTDSIYKEPGCKRCYAPVLKMDDGKYHCCSCGEEAEIDKEMLAYFKQREETKTEIRNCINCGGENCMKTHYMKNPVTLEWQMFCGECEKCGARFMV